MRNKTTATLEGEKREAIKRFAQSQLSTRKCSSSNNNMKITLFLILVGGALSFSPAMPGRAFLSSNRKVGLKAEQQQNLDDLTLEEEVEQLVAEEVNKVKRMSNLRNDQGVEYAPWMKITPEDEIQIRKMVQERAEARRRRKELEATASGSLFADSQFQELSGTGLKGKVIDGEVELEWSTGSEKNTKGFVVKRRPAKTPNFEVIASYENWAPLVTKGPDGGVYRFLDTTVTPGEWFYRVSECDKFGSVNDICQCLVDVQTKDEQRNAMLAAVGIGAIFVGALLGGIFLDPMGGYQQ